MSAGRRNVRLLLYFLYKLHRIKQLSHCHFAFRDEGSAVVGAFSSSTNSLAASVSSNFSAANFSAANFSAANFSAANFSAANFSAVIRSERRMLLPNSSLVVALLTTAPQICLPETRHRHGSSCGAWRHAARSRGRIAWGAASWLASGSCRSPPSPFGGVRGRWCR